MSSVTTTRSELPRGSEAASNGQADGGGRSTAGDRRAPGVLAAADRLHRRADPLRPRQVLQLVRSIGRTTWRAGSTTSSPAAARTSCTSSAGSRSWPALLVAPGPPLRRVRRRGLAGRHRHQPAHRQPADLLRHRPAGLRPDARRADTRPAGAGGRPGPKVRGSARQALVASSPDGRTERVTRDPPPDVLGRVPGDSVPDGAEEERSSAPTSRPGEAAERGRGDRRRLRPDLPLRPAGLEEAAAARGRRGAARLEGPALRPRAVPDQRLLAEEQRPLRLAQDPPADLRRRGRGRRRRRDRPRRPRRGRHRRGGRPLAADARDARVRRCPCYIENTAGGENAVARRFDALARLWEAVSKAETDVEVGFCFDTCHAHAAGEELSDAVERVLAIVGRIDLLHANDSRDPPGTGADRHANLGKGEIGADALRAMIRAAGPPVVVETPGGAKEMRADIEFVRKALALAGGRLRRAALRTSSIVRQIQSGDHQGGKLGERRSRRAERDRRERQNQRDRPPGLERQTQAAGGRARVRRGRGPSLRRAPAPGRS